MNHRVLGQRHSASGRRRKSACVRLPSGADSAIRRSPAFDGPHLRVWIRSTRQVRPGYTMASSCGSSGSPGMSDPESHPPADLSPPPCGQRWLPKFWTLRQSERTAFRERPRQIRSKYVLPVCARFVPFAYRSKWLPNSFSETRTVQPASASVLCGSSLSACSGRTRRCLAPSGKAAFNCYEVLDSVGG
jgi:hypothetical protein